MECTETKYKLQELIDDSLDFQESALIKAHLKSCRSCVQDYLLLKLVAGSINSLPFPELNDNFNIGIFHALGLEHQPTGISAVVKWTIAVALSAEAAWLALAGIGISIGLTKLDPAKLYVWGKGTHHVLTNLNIYLVKAGLDLTGFLGLFSKVAETLLKGSHLPIQIAIASTIAFVIIALTSKQTHIYSKI
jgi:hypothetical protein